MPPRAVVDGDPVAAARAVSLTYASDAGEGIRRVGRGKRFRYTDGRKKAVRDRETLSRIRALAIPPAWTSVWICPDPDGHVQATGRDAKGRKEYRYHAKWRAVRDEAKYTRLVELCRALPAVRATVEKDLACACLCKRKVVATVVALMERAQLRVGNDEYARTNGDRTARRRSRIATPRFAATRSSWRTRPRAASAGASRLRAIEPIVASYLAPAVRRRHA